MTVWESCFLAAVWCACASMLRRSVRSKKSMLPTGVLLWTCSYTLTRPPIYDAADRVLGGGNLTNLVYRVVMIAALGCLHVMLFRATGGRRPRLESGVAAATVGFITLQSALFRPGSWPHSSTYLAEYGGELPRELFWNLLPLCAALFAMHILVAVVIGWGGHSVRATRWGIALIGASSVVDLGWAAWNLASSAVRLSGVPRYFLPPGGDPIGEVILGVSAVLTGCGVLLASSEGVVDQGWLRLLLLRSWSMWWRLVRTSPGLSLSRGPALALTLIPLEPEHTLFRRWVELVDGERSMVFMPSRRQRRLLEVIEQALGAEVMPAGDVFDGLLADRR